MLLVLISFGAVAAESRQPTPKVKRHRWRCHFVGRMVFCDLEGKPLQASLRETEVALFERTPPEFAPLVTPPSSFR